MKDRLYVGNSQGKHIVSNKLEYQVHLPLEGMSDFEKKKIDLSTCTRLSGSGTVVFVDKRLTILTACDKETASVTEFQGCWTSDG